MSCCRKRSGSILFARLAARLFHKPELPHDSPDHNPGAANAFQFGGFWCGVFTLTGDLLQGFLPVFLYRRSAPPEAGVWLESMILIAPVLGHTFSIFHRGRGGKGIAASFGCLRSLVSHWQRKQA